MKRSVAYFSLLVIVFTSTGTISESYENLGVMENVASSTDVKENQQILQNNYQEKLNANVEDKRSNQQETPISSFDCSRNSIPDELQQEYYAFNYNSCNGLPLLPNDNKYLVVENENVQKYMYNPWSKLFYPDFGNALLFSNGFDLGYDTVSDTMDASNIFDYRVEGEDPTLITYRPRRQGSDEDFLEQLEHDAIINNILPTMDEPFFREAGIYSTQEEPNMPSSDHIVAYFPKTYGPPLLLYLGCTSNIKDVYNQNVQMSSLY